MRERENMSRTKRLLALAGILLAVTFFAAARIPSSVVNLNNLSATQQRGLVWQVGQLNTALAAQPAPTPTPWTNQTYADSVCGAVFDSYDVGRIETLNQADANTKAILKAYADASNAQKQAARTALGLP
jgi:hypothetical protein